MHLQPICVALDLETTGLHPEQDAIIEVGAVKFSGERVLDTFTTLVAPGMSLPYRIQRLTGIRPAELRSAPPLSASLTDLRNFLADHTLVGHNIPFDVAFLRRVNLAQHNPLIDTYELASALLPRLSNYTLASVSEALGVPVESAHRALADARMTHGVFVALLERLEGLDDSVVEALAALPAARSWTPGVLVRAVLRERGLAAKRLAPSSAEPDNPFASLLGAQIGRSLGVDPAVLSMAVASATSPAARRAWSEDGTALGDAEHHEAVEALRAGAGTRRTRERVATWAEEGGALLVEHDGSEASHLDALAPLVRWAATSGERVLVAVTDAESAERLVHVVLPAALAQGGEDVRTLPYAFLAEPDAYLCTHRWLGGAREAEGTPLSRDAVRGLAKLVVWAPGTESGWTGEVTLTGKETQAWERARHGAEYLDQMDRCAYSTKGHCFSARARQAAEGARIIVTTHTALAAALAGIPSHLEIPRRVIVLDAHFFEEELRRIQTLTLDRQELLDALDLLAHNETPRDTPRETPSETGAPQHAQPHGQTRGQQGTSQSRRVGLFHTAARNLEAAGKQGKERAWFSEVSAARSSVERFFAAMLALLSEAIASASGSRHGDEPLEHQVIRLDAEARQLASWEGATAAWTKLERDLTTVLRRAREVAQTLREAEKNEGQAGSPPAYVLSGVGGDLMGAAWRLEGLCSAAARHFGAGEPDNEIAWLRVPYQQDPQGASGRSGVRAYGKGKGKPDNQHNTSEASRGGDPDPTPRVPTLQAAPVAVGTLLETLCQNGYGLVLASSALSVAGEFEHVRGLFGLPGDAPAVPHTPDYTEQTILALPDDVPEPNAQHFQQQLEATLIMLARALSGRLVAIFPSHAALRASYGGIRRALEQQDILVLAQGQDGSARQLWRTFHAEPRTVLLGAGTFWGGHEQRDRPPACIVVARLPFPVASDPMISARSSLWDDPQAQFMVPQTALKTRQALNGLAWSHSSRNAVVLFDRRVQTRGYGSTILSTLPRCAQHTDSIARLTERIADWVAPAPAR